MQWKTSLHPTSKLWSTPCCMHLDQGDTVTFRIFLEVDTYTLEDLKQHEQGWTRIDTIFRSWYLPEEKGRKMKIVLSMDVCGWISCPRVSGCAMLSHSYVCRTHDIIYCLNYSLIVEWRVLSDWLFLELVLQLWCCGSLRRVEGCWGKCGQALALLFEQC